VKPSPTARRILADAIDAQGPAWANTASSVRAGSYSNVWLEAALHGIETALRTGYDDAEPDPL